MHPRFTFIEDCVCTSTAIVDHKPDVVIHLAAKAGVRPSLENPIEYTRVNVLGFVHVLEQCRQASVQKVLYASSSSVYGLNHKVPFSETDPIDFCNSPYAASKRAMEIYAQTFSQLYGIQTIGLRFFTVYGPRGRPDMAPHKFLKAVSTGRRITQYGDGSSRRDYTYISDIVNGICSALEADIPHAWRLYNLGGSSPVSLTDFIRACEAATNCIADTTVIGEQRGDVPHTYADIARAQVELGYEPQIGLASGLAATYAHMLTENDNE